MKSRRGLDVSTQDARAVDALDTFSDRLLRIAPGAEEILSASDRFPHEPTVQLAKAFFWLFGQTADAQGQAAAALAAIPDGALNARELRWQNALLLWHDRSFDAAASVFESITCEWPEDLAAAKAAEFLYYVLGQQFSGPRFRNHMMRMRSVHENDPDFLSMEAFAHELCGDMELSRTRAEASLSLAPGHPWAQHALEHILLWEGNSDEALRVMTAWIADWESCARPIHSHNAWHLALAHVDRLENTDGFQVFDAHVWMKTPDMVVEQLDSIAYLWRAEMAGIDIPQDRWMDLLPHISLPSRTLFMPFASAHYAYALARAGENDGLAELLTLAERRSMQSDAEAKRVWAPTGLSVVRAAAAHGGGDFSLAAQEFTAALPRITHIGGSDAQDDLFRFAHIDSLRHAGHRADARTALERRMHLKTPSPLECSMLAAL